jgi:CHAD domain-containing protein
MALPPEILDRAPAEGARTVVLALLAEAREQADRLAGRPDADAGALHDFRVSVRRLRSTLRAWRKPLGRSVRDKDLRRLRRVARATTEARDAEVLLAWVAETAGSLAGAHRAAADWMAARLAPRDRGPDLFRTVERFRAAADALSRRLKREIPPASTGTYAAALAERIREQAASVERSLSRVETAADASLAHRARIEGKRLRYLLEPLRDTAGAGSGPAVKALKRLQDILGDLNDAHHATAAIRDARHEAEAERARADEAEPGLGLRPGLLALELRASRRAEQLFARLRSEVLATRGAAVLDPSLEVAAALEALASRGEPSAPESRQLLQSLPEGAQDWPGLDEEAGWLPQAGGREGFRVLRDASGERFFREVATGAGSLRGTVAEPIDAATFEAYWPLTEGRRFHRVRRADPASNGWRVDEFLDRPLVLAVGPAEGASPEWLEPVLVRDVGAERAYRDDAIARRAPRS